MPIAMKLLVLLTAALFSNCLWARNGSSSAAASENVNSRYTVESVEIRPNTLKVSSRELREDLDSLVGRHFDPSRVAELANRLRRELRMAISHSVEKGLQPEHVRVVFEGRPRRWDEDDAKVTKLVYHQKQGTSAGVEGGFDFGANRVELGVQTDADRLLERYTGLNAEYSRRFGERARLRFEFETFHQEWDPATETALQTRPDLPGVYRERYNLEPSVILMIAPGLTLSAGLSFQQFQTQFPAARFEAANAVATTLRQRRRWSSDSSAGQELDAGYSLRAATRSLDSDFVYTRHLAEARYSGRYDRHSWTLRGLGGYISGSAPLFERFALGDTRTLRGWNKFDVSPVGGSRVVYGSAQYRYRWVGVFYDAGSVWDSGRTATVRHAAGVLIASGFFGEGPFLTLGFPLRNGSFTPLFSMGMVF
jgi:Omp85 superfamily domain